MFWELPGPRQFVAEIVDSLDFQRHALVSVPRTLERQGFHLELQRSLRGRELGELTILRASGSESDPLDLLAAGLAWRAASVEDLLEDRQRPSRFVLLEEPETCTRQDLWHDFLRRAASRTQVLGRTEVQFVVVASAPGELPREDVFLSVHPWWGRLSSLDVDWMTERRLAEVPPRTRADRYWIRALSRAFARCDPQLASALVESCPRDLRQVEEVTANLEPDGRTVSLSSLELPGVADRLRLTGRPSNGDCHRLWSEGLIDWQDDHGPVVLTRAIVARGDHEELRRRLWHGQLEVFMPLVEQARLAVCGYLEQAYGRGWELALSQRAGLSVDGDVSSEIGHLARLAGALKSCSNPLPRPAQQAIYDWRDIRNDLAHWSPVSYEALERGVEASDRLMSLA